MTPIQIAPVTGGNLKIAPNKPGTHIVIQITPERAFRNLSDPAIRLEPCDVDALILALRTAQRALREDMPPANYIDQRRRDIWLEPTGE